MATTPAEPYPTRSVRRIEVIEVVGLAGQGVAGDPMREVVSWWTPEGEFLAKSDPVTNPSRCCEEGFFGQDHACRKQEGR